MNKHFSQSAKIQPKNAPVMNGITLAKSNSVKKTGIFRIITVAIGILVAMLIALTIWIRTPDDGPSGTSESSREPFPPFAASNFIERVQSLVDITPDR